MKTQEELGRRLASISDMQSVVATMKTLASANIRQYEKALDATREYDRVVQLGLQILLQCENRNPDPKGIFQRLLAPQNPGNGRHGIIVFGTDQGLCGRFNEEISTAVIHYLESHDSNPHTPLAILVGARLEPLLPSQRIDRTSVFRVPANVPDITSLLQDIMPEIVSWQELQNVQRIDIFYNRRISTASFEPAHQPLLPLDQKFLSRMERKKWESRGLPVYRLSPRKLLSGVIRQFLFVQLYRACAESRASENASRIAAMQKAEENIEEKLVRLRAEFNQQRQNSITDELLDIVSGFNVAISKRK